MKQVNFKEQKKNKNMNGYQSIPKSSLLSPNDVEEKRYIQQQNQRQRRLQPPPQFNNTTEHSGPSSSSRSARRYHEADHRTILKLFLSTCFILTVLFLFNRFLYLWSYVHESLPIQDAAAFIKDIPSTEHIHDYIKTYATQRLAGTEQDQALAKWTLAQWQEMGLVDSHMETFYPTLNQPSYHRLAILNDNTSTRPILEHNHHQQQLSSEHPPFHGYSANGNVTGRVVYVNYGQVNDYRYLETQGVNFTGTIALIRQDSAGGGSNSKSGLAAVGTQIALAEQHGCIGALTYADPGDEDGPAKKWNAHGEPEQAYPLGPWRPPTSVPQASVMNMAFMVGDPWSPGAPAKNTSSGHQESPRETAYSLPSIPSLPLSWEQVIPLLQLTYGRGVPANVNWVGGDHVNHTIDFSSGPSRVPVQLVNINSYQAKPINNVIARIIGQKEPNRAIILGCQRDALSSSGVVESASSSAIMHELVRTLGLLLQQGWRPRRTIILASWDASSYGAVGSTEWAESHQDWISKEVVAYIDIGSVFGQDFDAQGSPLLHRLLYQVTQDVLDPHENQGTVFDSWKKRRQAAFGNEGRSLCIHEGTSRNIDIDDPYHPLTLVDPLMVNDDGSSFFHHLGVSTLSLQFKTDHFGGANSEQDNLDWMKRFGDSTFAYHQTMVRVAGLVALQLSSERLLPMHPVDYTALLLQYADDLSAEQGCQTLPALTTSLLILQSTSVIFDHATAKCQHQLDKKKHYSKKLKKHVRQYNQAMLQFERSLIDPLGLPGREWYKHAVYGPHPDHPASPLLFPSIAQAMHEERPVFTRQMEERVAAMVMSANGAIKT